MHQVTSVILPGVEGTAKSVGEDIVKLVLLRIKSSVRSVLGAGWDLPPYLVSNLSLIQRFVCEDEVCMPLAFFNMKTFPA